MISRNLRKTDLNLFVVFSAIYDEGNITRAAEALNVTQPAVSNNISRLRDLFNDPLFVRVKNGVSPTPLARDLIGPIRQALGILDRTVKERAEFDPATSERTIHISMGDLAEVMILNALVQTIRAESAGIRIHNYLTPRDSVPLKLTSGEIDFAIEPVVLNDSNLHSQRIVSDHFVCVLRKGHPLLKHDLTIEDYVGLEHIQVSGRRSGAGFIDMVLYKLKRRRQIAVRVQHYLMTHSLLLDSDMAITVPSTFAQRVYGEEEFELRPLPFAVPALELWLHWHASVDDNPSNRWLRDKLLASANGAIVVT